MKKKTIAIIAAAFLSYCISASVLLSIKANMERDKRMLAEREERVKEREAEAEKAAKTEE